MRLTPRAIQERVKNIDVDIPDWEKLMWFEMWKNKNGIDENNPANVQMFERYALSFNHFVYDNQGRKHVPNRDTQERRCGTCFLWQRQSDSNVGYCRGNEYSEQMGYCREYIPKRGGR